MDAWLLKRFPGRLLEEIDEMDWLRYSRALEAQYIDDIEDLRISGGNDLSTEQWQEIKNNDAIWRRVMAQQGGDEGDE
jgi:hypothetical protein